MLDILTRKRLIFVTGKGGVGKSTLTAALGRALAKAGRPTLIVETDAFSTMPDLLGVEPDGRGAQAAGEHLWAENLEADECFVRTLGRFVPSERVARAVAGNRVTRVFFKSAPSVNEFVILDQIVQELEREESGAPAYEHIIVDLPASGHALTFLSVPDTLHGMMKVGPIAKRARHIAELIADASRSAILAVCVPEEMPVKETIELAQNLEEALGRGLSAVAVNMLHEPPVAGAEREAFEGVLKDLRQHETIDEGSISQPASPALHKLLAGSALAIGWHDRDMHYLKMIKEQVSAPVFPLPVVYELDGPAVVEALCEQL